jgi:hypothetical protein
MVHTNVACVLSGCCICFTHMLQVFHLDVVYVCTGYTRVLDVCCKCFKCFERMLQMFLLDVAKVDLMLHILLWTYL